MKNLLVQNRSADIFFRFFRWPVSFSARPCLRFGSWDGTLLPLPFARVLCRYGEPIEVDASASDAEEEIARQALDRELARITTELDTRTRAAR